MTQPPVDGLNNRIPAYTKLTPRTESDTGTDDSAGSSDADRSASGTGAARIAGGATRRPRKFLRLPQVRERVAHSPAWIYREIQRGEFPAPIVIGDNGASVWIEDEITAWQEAQITRSRAGLARRRGRPLKRGASIGKA